MTDTQLIPRRVLFNDPDRAEVRLSNDGRYISFLAPFEGVLNIWVAERDNLQDAVPVTKDKGRGIRSYTWAWDNKHLLYTQDCKGNENWVVYALNIESRIAKPLTPEQDVHANIDKISRHIPDEIILSLNERRPEFHDLYRLNILTGERTLLFQNDEYAGIITDDRYNIRFALKVLSDGGVSFLQHVGDAWEEFITVNAEDANNTNIVEFDASGKILYILDSRHADTTELVLYNLETGERNVVYQDMQADVSGVMLHPIHKTLQAVTATYDRKRWTFFEDKIRQDMEHLRSLKDAEVEIVSRTQDDQLWIVAYLSDDAPVQYYLFDRRNLQMDYLFCNRMALEGIPLSKMQSVVIKSRDGLTIVGYLTLPLAADPQQTGKPIQPLPMILCVHGGPQARDYWGFNPLHQWFANRGYAVLNVNYRGSTGFGKSFIKAGNGEWAAKMHDDLLDTVQWAVDNEIAAKDKICIYGGSYGGYAALVGLTFTPEVFACGVDIVGPSSLETLVNSIPPYWKPLLDRLRIMIGADPETPEGKLFLKARSPLTHADQIIRPLLIGHGANDPRVKLAEAEQIVAKLQEKNIPVTYVVYPDEGHGFQRPENRLSFHAVTEMFLAEVLQGHCEPIGQDFEGASINIPAGAELVEQVPEVIKTLSRN